MLALRGGALPTLPEGEFYLLYAFRTPWSPPIPVVAAMAAQHPTLNFLLRHAEPWDGFAGEARYSDGELDEELNLDIEDVLHELDFLGGHEPRLFIS